MFCKYCGKETPENAYVCLGCGCVVDNKAVGKNRNAGVFETEENPKNSLLFKLFLIISFSMTLVGLGMCLLSFAYLDVSVSVSQSLYSSYHYADEYVYPNYVFSLLSLIFGAVGMGLGIVTFVFGLKEKERFKMIAILNFCFTLILFISIFFCAGAGL